MEILIQIIQLLLSLSILVILHEFGHYAAAKFFGCRVEKFYLFMDWKFSLFKKKIGETEFGIGWLPLGGYVKIAGFIDESMDTKGVETPPQPWELRAKPAWQRLVVMLGGIFVNLILAWVVYSCLLFFYGTDSISMNELDDGFVFNETAKNYGFQDGDKIISINDKVIAEYWSTYSGVSPSDIRTSLLFVDWKKDVSSGVKYKTVTVKRNSDIEFVKIYKDSVAQIMGGEREKIRQKLGTFFMPATLGWEVESVVNGSIADNLGITGGDKIIELNNTPVSWYHAAIDSIKSNINKPIEIVVKKQSGEIVRHPDVIIKERFGTIKKNTLEKKHQDYSVLQSFTVGLKTTIGALQFYWTNITILFDIEMKGWKSLGGMIAIGSMFDGEIQQNGWSWESFKEWGNKKIFNFWFITALLSIILAVMNLLPIPALDGGHALIAFGEMITGYKMPLKVLMPLQIIGMSILLILAVWANLNDVINVDWSFLTKN